MKWCRRTGYPPLKLSAGHMVLGPRQVSQERMSPPKIVRRTRGPRTTGHRGSGVPLRTSCPPTLYHETEIILHCAIICSCFTQRETSVLLGECSRGGGARGPRTNSPPPFLPESWSYIGPRRRFLKIRHDMINW